MALYCRPLSGARDALVDPGSSPWCPKLRAKLVYPAFCGSTCWLCLFLTAHAPSGFLNWWWDLSQDRFFGALFQSPDHFIGSNGALGSRPSAGCKRISPSSQRTRKPSTKTVSPGAYALAIASKSPKSQQMECPR